MARPAVGRNRCGGNGRIRCVWRCHPAWRLGHIRSRSSRCVVGGHGPVFAPGKRLLGWTTMLPGSINLLGGISAIVRPDIVVGVCLNIYFILALLWAGWMGLTPLRGKMQPCQNSFAAKEAQTRRVRLPCRPTVYRTPVRDCGTLGRIDKQPIANRQIVPVDDGRITAYQSRHRSEAPPFEPVGQIANRVAGQNAFQRNTHFGSRLPA